MRRFLKPGLLVLLFATAMAASWIPLPYYSVGPGPAREVEPLIHVTGHKVYPSDRRLIMTTVAFRPLAAVGAVAAWLDPHESVVSRSDLYPSGGTVAQEDQRQISEMDTSKIDAAFVVLHSLTSYPSGSAGGVLIESVVSRCPAEGKLFAGDLVKAIDGVTITDRKQAIRQLDRIPAGDPISLQVTAAGQTHTITVTRAQCVKGFGPIVGIGMVDSFPFGISISSGDVGGPSAGLMWALGLYDLLTPGDLTGGRSIAGTGTIDLDGKVGPIGGIQDKIVAAEDAGARIFLVPQGNLQDARTADDGSMKLVAVSSFQDALSYLQGGGPATA